MDTQTGHGVTLYVHCLVLFVRMIARYVSASSGQNAELLDVKGGGTYSYTLFLRTKILHNNGICDLELVS
jgi:hypothetical protein